MRFCGWTTPQIACSRRTRAVEPQAAHCPHCGEPIAGHRILVLWIGVGGVGVLIFVMGLMWLTVRNDDLMKAPPLPVQESIAQRV